jgi:hypothetical protein
LFFKEIISINCVKSKKNVVNEKIVYTPLRKIGINYLKIKRSNDDNPT